MAIWVNRSNGLVVHKEFGQQDNGCDRRQKDQKLFGLGRLGMAVQRGNATSIMGTVPPGQKQYELYYL